MGELLRQQWITKRINDIYISQWTLTPLVVLKSTPYKNHQSSAVFISFQSFLEVFFVIAIYFFWVISAINIASFLAEKNGLCIASPDWNFWAINMASLIMENGFCVAVVHIQWNCTCHWLNCLEILSGGVFLFLFLKMLLPGRFWIWDIILSYDIIWAVVTLLFFYLFGGIKKKKIKIWPEYTSMFCSCCLLNCRDFGWRS